MSRRSLRPQLNQIRGWVRQGRTDAWIAHQLDVTVQQIQAFKREQELEADGADPSNDEVDLRAEDDAAIAAELEAEEVRRREQQARAAEEAARKAAEEDAKAATEPEASSDGDQGAEEAEARPRHRRGGRSRRRTGPKTLEWTCDHGEEGYGLWLDPAVQDDPVYAEHWAGHRPIVVTIEEDQIVIRRSDGEEDNGDDD
jgi:hypothetical protein